jgi:diguanylate cyclase (GGDEF)-like protein
MKWFGTNTDIHDQKMAEDRLNHFATHDTLTKLPNRNEFMSHLSQALADSKKESSLCFAVLFLDIDRFKLINDSLGHIVGDKLLCKIAERLKDSVRPRDVVARMGGDEFTVLLNRCGSESDVKKVAERIQTYISEPYKINNYEIFTSASIGIVILDDINRLPEDFLRDADAAMYRAKETGKAHFELFSNEMHTRNINLLRVENDLRRAVERNEMRVFYQPVIDLNDGTISEFEALIRWQHPTRGLVPPNDFIGVAEETGMIIQIGQWILEESCRQTVEWQKKFETKEPLSISVNLSAKQLMHPKLLLQIEEILLKTGLNPIDLKLEVTESMVMKQPDLALEVLNRIKKLGISLSTDDFGTGYSSLSYLHRFPFNRLKIDRSFVSEMDVSKNSGEIVRSILMLAQNLDLDVVAEGIETLVQNNQLINLKCPKGQGYLFSKPVPAEVAEQLLIEQKAKKHQPINHSFSRQITEISAVY